jgi:CYTH domain-containing protein
MAPLGGGEPLHKLGQKYRAPDQSTPETTMTNIYLDRAEYERLTLLNASELTKKRYRYQHEGRQYSIDVFEEALQGLILAEIECQTMDDYQQLQLPSFADVEVTEDPFFTGGNLVTLSQKLLQAKLTKRFGEDEEARAR